MKESKTISICTYEQLQGVFRRAQEETMPVYLYRKPDFGGITLDFSAWNQVEVLDDENLMAIVQPGVLLQDLRTVAGSKGLRFIPGDTALFETLSVGEWVYRGCPNLSCWKYGAGKHFLLGSTYVFPNGDMTAVGGKCIKNVTGYDFTRFLAGGYADLGAGVQYILKLLPQPAARRSYDVTIDAMEDMVKLIGALQAAPVPPAWLFWADKTAGIRLFGEKQRTRRVLFELDGNEAEVREYAARVDDILTACHAEVLVSGTVLPDVSFVEDNKNEFWLLDEFKVPYTSLGDFAARADQLILQDHCKGGLFGQAADGKIHLYLDRPAGEELITSIQETARALGGAASGKYRRLYGSSARTKMDIIESNFKKGLDPKRIFNRMREAVQ